MLRRLGLDALQFLTTAAYARLLDRTRARWALDHTWVTVAVGDALCIGFAKVRMWAARPHATPEAAEAAYEDALRRSFVISGVVIIAWCLERSEWMRQRLATAANEYAARQADGE
jgi:hypothetical protein